MSRSRPSNREALVCHHVSLLGLTCLAGLVLCLQACAAQTDTPCSLENPCLGDAACDPIGVCVPAEPLGLVNQRLADGALGLPYRDELRARGGLPPYTFALAEAPTWLSVQAGSGLLTGTPDSPCRELLVRVAVTDSSFGPGRTEQLGLRLSVAGCVGGQVQVCFDPQAGRCLQGVRTCPDGLWGECENGVASVDPAHCGPACAPCDPLVADRCAAGLCGCGEGAACGGGDTCCDGACTRVEEDPRHCGGCGQACRDRLQHVDEVRCAQGRCDYDACLPGFLDCDGARENGCETPASIQHCGVCGRDCSAEIQGADGAVCRPAPDGQLACDYQACQSGFLDCDGARENGCESPRSRRACAACDDDCLTGPTDGLACLHLDDGPEDSWRCGCQGVLDCDLSSGPRQCCDGRCRPFDDPAHCGTCGRSCLADPSLGGPLCLDPGRGQCGCLRDADCGPLALCCDRVCVPRVDEQCLACGQACDLQAGGPRCDPARPRCTCEDHAECNDWPGGQQMCFRLADHAACTCGSMGRACQGGPESQCCQLIGQYHGCVDTRTNPEHCGRCGVRCASGMACVDGVCECNVFDGVRCPAEGGGTRCKTNRCVCSTFMNGDLPCREGATCCDGTQGGQGGPGGEPDLGCCRETCGQNGPGDCVQGLEFP
jgi:hypothetical protein